MSDFLTNLIRRHGGATPAIQPRLPSLFEAAGGPAGGDVADPTGEAEAPRAPVPRRAADDPALTASESTLDAPPVFVPPAGVVQPEPAQPGVPTARRESTPPAASANPPANRFQPLQPPAPRPRPGQLAPQPAAAAPPVVRAPPVPLPATPVAAKPARVRHSADSQPNAVAPAIHVTIGRVEVRAVQAPPAAPRAARPAAPRLSLEEYLQPRSGGTR